MIAENDAFLATILLDLNNHSPKLVYADRLDEDGQHDLAYAYRWCAKNKKWPLIYDTSTCFYKVYWDLSYGTYYSCLPYFLHNSPYLNADHCDNGKPYATYEDAMKSLSDAFVEIKNKLDITFK